VQSSEEIRKAKRWSRRVFLGTWLSLGVLAAVGHPRLRAFADSDTAIKEGAHRLADRVVAVPGFHGPLRLDWHPAEKWSEGEATRWHDALRDEFDRRALRLTDDASVSGLAVYAAETPAQVVLTAKMHIGDHDEVRIIAISRVSLPPAELPVAPIRIERQLIYESPDRILDASSLWNGAEGGLAVLLYKNFEVTALRVDAKGELKQTVPLNVAGLKPVRDPRAEMSPRASNVAVQLWGKVCDFSWDAPVEMKCRAEKAPSSGKPAWRMATVLSSPCDDASWTVSQPAGDPTLREALHLAPGGANPGSSADVTSEFPGPVLVVNGEQNPSGALVVVRNLHTGNYEVYKITLACGD
jgi:hypothetical protein